VLNSLADRLMRSALLRHLLFLVAALFAVVLIGYHFGTFDQSVHIPYLKKSVDPSLYPGDKFLDLRFVHYSFFWFIFQPFYRLGILEPVMFAVHLLATYLTFWMLWELSITLFDNPLAALITVMAFVFPHVGLPGFLAIEFSLLNRTFVFPFLLAAFVLYLRRRYLLTFLLLGLMYNLHAISVGFVAAMLLLDALLRWREIGWRKLLPALTLFLLGASPVLVWKVNHSGIDLTLRPEILDVAARGTLGTIYYLFSDQPYILFDTLNGLGTLALFLIGYRAAPSAQHNRAVIHFVYAIGLIVLANVITTYLLPVTILLQMQILRAAVFLLPFGYLYFANVLAKGYQDRHPDEGTLSALFVAFITWLIPIVPCLVWLGRGWLGKRRWRQIAAAVAVYGGMVVVMVATRLSGLWSPGIHVYGPRTPWVDVQLWAREHTPPETCFITPPHIFSNYVPGWRVFSERPTTATLTELMEMPFNPEYLDDWVADFEQVAPGAIARFDYSTPLAQAVTAEAYYSLTEADIIRVARRYGASYLVVEKPHRYDFPIAYENEGFLVYDLRGVLGETSHRLDRASLASASDPRPEKIPQPYHDYQYA